MKWSSTSSIAALFLFASVSVSASAASNETSDSKTAALLRHLLRFDASNPPGRTIGQAEYPRKVFDAAGIPDEIVKSPGGGPAHFVARPKGDGGKRPVLLAAHSDIVSAAWATWTVDPFGSALFEAGTDASTWGTRGVPVYGVYPCPLDNSTLVRMHGNDEWINVKSLDEGTQMIFDTLSKVAGK